MNRDTLPRLIQVSDDSRWLFMVPMVAFVLGGLSFPFLPELGKTFPCRPPGSRGMITSCTFNLSEPPVPRLVRCT